MRVAIAGGHGKIALLLAERLSAGGNEVLGIIRNPDHAGDVTSRGGEAAVFDLEAGSAGELADVIAGCDAVIFAAGAGAGSGAQRKWTVDRDGAVKLIQAAQSSGARRYVMISSVGAESAPDDNDVFSIYLRAKAQADDALRASGLDWTIVRPGRLTDEPGTGRVRLDSEAFRGQVPRADVAEVLAALLADPRGVAKILYVNGGDAPVAAALDRVLPGAGSEPGQNSP
jgi:nucleoside-diphosphate-sugar epimerase